ncbi:MAG TPA: hypothetical protein VMV94_05650 [Phycisphaerae bacterium]|nr:hypothetical protein [Phycisphaerae bacterium]
MTSDTPQSSGSGPPMPGGFDPAQLKSALKAFKKRLKLARLDDESRLGHGAMTGGGRSGIVAIPAPDRYPQAVWDELVRQGKLRYSGHGLYELLDKS